MEDIFDKFRPKEGENDLSRNFGMLIPSEPFISITQKPIPIWKRALCVVVGHKWGFAGVTYVGPGFPKKCSRCKVTKWFDKPNLRMRLEECIDKMLDKLWVPLCKIGLHRYKHHYSYTSYSYGGDPTPTIRQQVYKCSCCKKIKTVTLK
jgi:hypothetical protein